MPKQLTQFERESIQESAVKLVECLNMSPQEYARTQGDEIDYHSALARQFGALQAQANYLITDLRLADLYTGPKVCFPGPGNKSR